MDELFFAPNSSAGSVAAMGLVMAGLALAGALLTWRKGDRVELQVWLGFVAFGGLGLVLAYFVYASARSIVVQDGRVELRYVWPRPATEIPIAAIKEARVVYAGTKRPSPHLELELLDGTTYTGEGSSQHERVKAIVRLIETLRREQ